MDNHSLQSTPSSEEVRATIVARNDKRPPRFRNQRKGKGQDKPYRKDAKSSDPAIQPQAERHGHDDARKAWPKIEKPKLALMNIIHDPVEIFVSTNGIELLTTITRSVLATKDSQLARLLSTEKLMYVAALCTYNRMLQVNIRSGKRQPVDAKRLHDLVKDVKLPINLCNYIESIGVVTMSNGAKVIPMVQNTLDEMMDEPAYFQDIPIRSRRVLYDTQFGNNRYHFDYRTLEPILANQLQGFQAQVQMNDPYAAPIIQAGANQQSAWQFVSNYVLNYSENIRLSKIGLNFRPIVWDNIEGKDEMLISCVPMGNGQYLGLSPQASTESDGRQGATYSFRQGNVRQWLPAPGNPLLAAVSSTAPIEDLRLVICKSVEDSLAMK